MPGGFELDELAARRGDAAGARRTRESDHAIRVADVERVADQRHAERLALVFQEDLAGSATPSPSSSRNSVTRLALTPIAAARLMVPTMA